MYREEKRSWMKHLDFTIIDMVMLEAALILAYAWRFDMSWLFYEDIYKRIAVVALLIDICVLFFGESYTGVLRRNKYQELRHTITHCTVVFGGVLVYMYATKTSVVYSRQMLFAFWGMFIFLSYFGRVVLKRYIRRQKLQDKNKELMTVVSDYESVEKCLYEIAHDKYTDFKVDGIAITDKDMRGQEIQGIPVVASADTFMEYLRTNVVDQVYINGRTKESSEALATELVELGLTVHVALIDTSSMASEKRIEYFGDNIVLTSCMHFANARQLFVKRLMDIVGSLIGLVFTGLAFIIFAPIIKIQSPGPVFFKQVRIGKNGRRFNFYKFRSMYMDAEERKAELMKDNEMQGNMFKMENDPRIIPIGHFMRKYSVDELPQFWNVLKGDMSLVGTRPPTEDEFEQYQYHHKARLGIKPGLTGMWQVSGRSKITDFEQVVALDTDYIANWTLGLDMKILFKTVGVVLTGRGSK
ncbi:MAG: sugar transferase [Lachnospiraceae bacterium]|nr:sugar transferase [Lachnospiraceae bacterium]